MEVAYTNKFRRYFKENNIEIWANNILYSDEYTTTDTIVIDWNYESPRITIFSNSPNRFNSEQYYDDVMNLFEDLTQGEGTFNIKFIFVVDPSDYYPHELIEITSRIFCDNKSTLDSLLFSGFRRVLRTKDTECWRSVFSDDRGIFEEDSVVIFFEESSAHMFVFCESFNRIISGEYIDKLYGLVHDIKSYQLNMIVQTNQNDYSIEEKIQMARELYEEKIKNNRNSSELPKETK